MEETMTASAAQPEEAPIDNDARGANGARQEAARYGAPRRTCRLAGACGASGPGRHPSRRRCGSAAGFGAAALWPHAAIPFHLLPWVRSRHGSRSGPHAGQRDPCPGLRRLSPDELWRLRHTGAPADLRHQRSRRDTAGALGVGRQAPRRLLCARRPFERALRCERPRCGGHLRPRLSPENARLCRHGRAGGVVRPAR
jgi:hypothetical protein